MGGTLVRPVPGAELWKEPADGDTMPLWPYAGSVPSGDAALNL